MAIDMTLRPMSTSQVLDRTFQLYRGNFALFAGIAALPPALTLIGQLLSLGGFPILTRMLGATGSIVTMIAGVALFVILYVAGYALASGATVHAVSRVHLASPVTISESYKTVSPLLWRILVIIFLIVLMAAGAMLVGYLGVLVPTIGLAALAGSAARGAPSLLVAIAIGFLSFAAIVAAAVWAFRLYCRYSLAVPACVVERLPILASLRRSKFLSRESLFRIFLIYLLLGFMALALNLVLSIPNFIEQAFHAGKATLPFQVWSFVASFLAGTLAGPIGTIALALIYYDQRVRKEAFDLQLMMETIGQPAPPQAAGAAFPGMG